MPGRPARPAAWSWTDRQPARRQTQLDSTWGFGTAHAPIFPEACRKPTPTSTGRDRLPAAPIACLPPRGLPVGGGHRPHSGRAGASA